MTMEPDRVDSITEIATYIPDGLALLYVQFQGRPIIAGVLTPWLQVIQEAETDLWSLLTNTLDTAVGVSLDVFGSVLALPRGGVSDDTYRLRLRGRIRVLKSVGHPEDINAIARALLPVPFSVTTYAGAQPLVGALAVETHGALTDGASSTAPSPTALEAQSFLQAGAALGVRVVLTYSGTDDADTFTFSDDLTSPSDAERGWGDCTDLIIGGYLASVIG